MKLPLFQLSLAGFMNEVGNLIINNASYKRWIYDISGIFNIAVIGVSVCFGSSYKSVCLRNRRVATNSKVGLTALVRDGEFRGQPFLRFCRAPGLVARTF